MGWDDIDTLNTFVQSAALEIPTDKERVENNVSEGFSNNGRQTYRDVLLEGQRSTRRQQDR